MSNSKAVTDEKNYITDRFFSDMFTNNDGSIDQAARAGVFQSLSASYLRLETLLTTGQQVLFDIREGGTNQLGSEKRLQQSDQFIITHLAFAIKKIATATPSAAQQAIALLYTWVNSNTGLFDGTNDANIQAIYNGYLDFSLNRKTYVPAVDMRCFERVPDMQQGQPLAAIAGPVTYALKRDSLPNGLFGYFPVDYIRLNGYDLIQPAIQLPAAVNMAEASESNYGVLLIKGYLASNMGTSKSLGKEQQ